MEMFRKLSSQILIDLRELEGDYRVFNLQIDKAQSVLGMIIAGIGIFSMLWMDRLLFTGSPGLISGMLIARSCYVLITALFIYAVGKTNRVRIFDRLILGWLFLTVLFMLIFNFIRPVSYQSTAFDAIVIFSIYALSPLQLRQNILLVLGYSAGILFINYLFKTGTDPLALNDLRR